MRQNNYYTFKELLLGLRYEYLNIQNYLNELKKYTMLDIGGIEDYYFQIINNKVVLFIKHKEKNISQIDFFRNKNNGFVFDNGFNKKIKVTNNSIFSKNLELLLNSRFYNELGHTIIYNKDNDLLKLWIYPQAIVLATGFSEEKYIRYEAREDIIRMSSFNSFIFREDFYNLLQKKIPKELLNYYHQSIIENSPFDKNIIAPKIIFNSEYMTLNENGSSLEIKRKRKI